MGLLPVGNDLDGRLLDLLHGSGCMLVFQAANRARLILDFQINFSPVKPAVDFTNGGKINDGPMLLVLVSDPLSESALCP